MRAVLAIVALIFIVWVFVTVAAPLLEKVAEALR